MRIYNIYWEKWLDECGKSEPDFEDNFAAGWNSCREAVLEILKGDGRDFENRVRNL